MERIFGTDGVRGHANHYPTDVATALALGRAVGQLFSKQKNGKRRVIVGKDTRLSCYMLENALIAGLCSMGVDTLMLGPFPTPGVAFITRAYRADAGVVISASHNPFIDNGIKFFSSEGFKFPDEWEKKVETLVKKNDFTHALPEDTGIGRNSRIHDADGRYIEFCKATFPKRLSLKNLKVVLDCANGATYKVAPLVFKELDATVFAYGIQPNGLNINLECGSLYPQTIQKGVIDHKADIGLAFDGDGDRVIVVDENSQVVDGDAVLAICAKYMKGKGLLKNNLVVSTVACNLGLVKTLEEESIRVIRSAVGDRYVIQEMLNHEACLGGEQSGHMIFLDHNSTGDGIVAALQLMKIMIETDSRLSDLAASVQRFPQVMINVPVKTKPHLETLEKTQKEIRKGEKALGNSGFVLVRYSGTEPLLRVTVQGPKQKIVQQIAQDIASAAKIEIG